MTLSLSAFAVTPPRIRYRYYFTDFRSGRLLAMLPLTGVSLAEVIGGGTASKAMINLTDTSAQAQDPYGSTIPRRTCMWAEREVVDPATRQVVSSSVPWGGVVMGRSRKRGDRTMDLALVSWPSYWANRLMPDHTYVQKDKFQIMREIVADGVNQPASGALPTVPVHLAPLAVTTGPLSGVLADRTFLATDLRAILTEMQALGTSDVGFDWRFSYYRDPAVPTVGESFKVQMDLGFPRLGRVQSAALRWSSARADSRSRWGYIEDYTVTEDGSAVYNSVTALGAGTGPSQLRRTMDASAVGVDEIGYGFPRYETSLASSTTQDRTQNTVDAHAAGALRQGLAGAFKITGIKVRGDLSPTVDSYQLGDDATLRLDATTIGRDATFVGQVVGRSIDPPEKGRTETVTMDVQGALIN